MNSRERFHATFGYGQPDRVFMRPEGQNPDTRKRWAREGLRGDEHFNTMFGFDRIELVPLNPPYTEDLDAVWPRPTTRIVEKTAEWQVIENALGGKYRTWIDRNIGMNQWMEFPVRDRESWEHFKTWLVPDQPSRYPEYWDDLKRSYKGREYPLGITGGSYYGWIRDWVGMENLAIWYHDRPDLVHEMVEYVADFVICWTERALTEVPDIDYACIWEDMCFKTGPLISPELFRKFHLEPMKRAIRVFKDAGVRIIQLDSDGRVEELIPLWMEAGVDVVYPMEIAAGCDPVRYRRQFGKELRMFGGIDKRALLDGMPKKGIEDQLYSKVELIREGGYAPMVDHSIHPDVPFENFKYYIQLLQEVCTFL